MDYITTTQASKIWGISARRIAILCAEDRVDGVVKLGKTWLIPKTATKPLDARRKEVK